LPWFKLLKNTILIVPTQPIWPDATLAGASLGLFTGTRLRSIARQLAAPNSLRLIKARRAFFSISSAPVLKF
jgi:hypothetical protein